MKANPVGNAQVEYIQDKVDEVINRWLEDYPQAKSWWNTVSVGWVEVVNFLMRAVDYFIKSIDKLMDNGPDKKATVMAAIEEVYDYIVPSVTPIWLKPFSGYIKRFIFNTLINTAIDYFVEKYRSGEWNNSGETNLKFK